MTTTLTAPAAITLEVHICDQRRSYKVTFTGPNAEDQALTFVNTRSANHAFHELESALVPNQYTRLLDWLYPTCDHGLSASNCYGPQHFYYDEDEQARGLLNS